VNNTYPNSTAVNSHDIAGDAGHGKWENTRGAGSADIVSLPPERPAVTASLRTAATGASHLLGGLQRALLIGLLPVPARLGAAAAAWALSADDSEQARKWMDVIDIYVTLLKDSRKQIIAVARAQDAPELSQAAIAAIDCIEEAALLMEQPATTEPTSHAASKSAVRILNSAAHQLDEKLTALCRASVAAPNTWDAAR
jgi:hypothetical protein